MVLKLLFIINEAWKCKTILKSCFISHLTTWANVTFIVIIIIGIYAHSSLLNCQYRQEITKQYHYFIMHSIILLKLSYVNEEHYMFRYTLTDIDFISSFFFITFSLLLRTRWNNYSNFNKHLKRLSYLTYKATRQNESIKL